MRCPGGLGTSFRWRMDGLTDTGLVGEYLYGCNSVLNEWGVYIRKVEWGAIKISYKKKMGDFFV